MVKRITEIILNNEEGISYSFEVTPDIEEYELESLDLEPAFFSITWHAQTHACKDLDIAPLKLAKYLTAQGRNVLLHISCCNMRKDYLDDLLELLKDVEICNLFIILGEKFDSHNSDFRCSKDMIIYIRQRTGNYFCIGVAGFPDRDGNILQLKEKVTCGVDFILTQAFFECDSFTKFVLNCKEVGINVPIIPGIFPFENGQELEGFVKMCKVQLKEDTLKELSNQSGIEMVTKLLNEMIEQLKIRHFHFFTSNKIQRTTNLIKNGLLLLTKIIK